MGSIVRRDPFSEVAFFFLEASQRVGRSSLCRSSLALLRLGFLSVQLTVMVHTRLDWPAERVFERVAETLLKGSRRLIRRHGAPSDARQLLPRWQDHRSECP